MTGNENTATHRAASDTAARDGGGADRQESRYLVLWGDAVDTKQLGTSIALTSTAALAAFLLARTVFSALGAEEIVDGYALLAGLLTCVAAGAVCARVFRPKRVFVEAGFDEDRHELLAELSSPEATAGVPAEYLDEMRELGLFERGADGTRREDAER